ncbi:MAG: SIMPL domain-containing protein [Succinivibrionaceae bacterium]|nr:SIMPL domain-containing protein [Succinivibrionaceae bacterium]
MKTTGRIFLPLALAAICASAPVQADCSSSCISVTGSATLAVDPDTAEISLEVQVSAKDKNQVNSAVQKSVNAMTDFLENELKMKKEQIVAESIGIWPLYDYAAKTRVQIGFEGRRGIRIRTDDFKLIGPIVARAAEIENVYVSSVRYALKKPSEFARRARASAVEDSISKAKDLAALYRAKLVKVESVNYRQNYDLNDVQYVAASNRVMAKNRSLDARPDESYFNPEKIILRDSVEAQFSIQAQKLD